MNEPWSGPEKEHPSLTWAARFIRDVVGDAYHEFIPSPKKFSRSKKIVPKPDPKGPQVVPVRREAAPPVAQSHWSDFFVGAAAVLVAWKLFVE